MLLLLELLNAISEQAAALESGMARREKALGGQVAVAPSIAGSSR